MRLGQGVSGMRLENWRTWPARAVALVATVAAVPHRRRHRRALACSRCSSRASTCRSRIGNDLFQSRREPGAAGLGPRDRARPRASSIRPSDQGRASVAGAAWARRASEIAAHVVERHDRRLPGAGAGAEPDRRRRTSRTSRLERRRQRRAARAWCRTTPTSSGWQSVTLATADGGRVPGHRRRLADHAARGRAGTSSTSATTSTTPSRRCSSCSRPSFIGGLAAAHPDRRRRLGRRPARRQPGAGRGRDQRAARRRATSRCGSRRRART